MSIIPKIPLNLPEHFANTLLVWASDCIYALLKRRDSQNEWLKLAEILDFSPVEEACQAYIKRKSEKNVTHTCARLVRTLFIKYYCGFSLRQTEQAIRYHIGIKQFVGYNIHEMGCDHTTIERFDVWVATNCPRIYFDTVLKQIDHQFENETKKSIQYADTFAMEANAAPRSLVKLIREMCICLIEIGAKGNGELPDKLWQKIDVTQLLGKKDEKHWFHMTQKERDDQLFNTVSGALSCQTVVKALTTITPETQEWIEHLEKILADEIEIKKDETGKITTIQRLSKKKKGSYRIASAVDTDATFREHGKGKSSFGYNASVAVTDEFVREIQADTGATPDAVPIPDLLKAQQEHHEYVPEKIVYDSAAGSGKTIEAVSTATDGKTQLVTKMRDNNQNRKTYSPQDFDFNEDEMTLKCPNGQVTNVSRRDSHGDGWQARFTDKQHGCATCPLRTNCLTNPETQKMRSVFISDYRKFALLARAYMLTDSFSQEMRQRNHVERIIAALVRYNDARRSQRVGVHFADYQLKMSGMAYNVKKWIKKIDKVPSLGGVCLLDVS